MNSALRQVFRLSERDFVKSSTSISTFLCPAVCRSITSIRSGVTRGHQRRTLKTTSCRSAAITDVQEPVIVHAHGIDQEPTVEKKSLPFACPGCGALTQTIQPDAAGFYSSKRLQEKKPKDRERAGGRLSEDEAFKAALAVHGSTFKQMGLEDVTPG